MKLAKYRTIIFDCDGVLLNSNKIKTEAFFDVASKFSLNAAKDLVNYHQQNGGISRYKKFEYFEKSIIKKYVPDIKLETENLLKFYSEEVKNKLLICEVAKGLNELKKLYCESKWMVVSGSDEKELNFIFKERFIYKYFTAGIFGSPADKETILKREINNNNICYPAVYIGDSKYDYLVSKKCNLDFIFLSKWTELKDWENFTLSNDIVCFTELNNLN